MIADDRRKALIIDKAVEHLAILFPFDDQVSDSNYPIVVSQLDQLKQVSQFVKASVNITKNDCAAHL